MMDFVVEFFSRRQNRERELDRWVGSLRVWKLLGNRGIGTSGRRIVSEGRQNLGMLVAQLLVLYSIRHTNHYFPPIFPMPRLPRAFDPMIWKCVHLGSWVRD